MTPAGAASPPGVTKAGKLYLPAVQQGGADHSTGDSSSDRMNAGGHSRNERRCFGPTARR
jgi:hypothetical protein